MQQQQHEQNFFLQKLFDQKAFKGLRNGQKVTNLDKSFE
jgi:hypothetical protein